MTGDPVKLLLTHVKAMPSIEPFELGHTRSARARWTLLEAGLAYESVGNSTETYVHSTETNTMDFVLPEIRHVLAIIEQNSMMYERAAAALDAVLGATDIIAGYTISWGREQGLLSGASVG